MANSSTVEIVIVLAKMLQTVMKADRWIQNHGKLILKTSYEQRVESNWHTNSNQTSHIKQEQNRSRYNAGVRHCKVSVSSISYVVYMRKDV